MKIGSKVNETLTIENTRYPNLTGIVTYIHPKRRYYVAEFSTPGGKVSETFYFKYRRSESALRAEKGEEA